jgi:hypothetical protein
MEDLVDIHKAFFGNPAKPLFSRTTARAVSSTPHGTTWQTERIPGAIARARGERQMVGGLNRFTTANNPKAWEVEQGIRQGVRQSRASAAKRGGRRVRTVTGVAQPQAPTTSIPEWLR